MLNKQQQDVCTTRLFKWKGALEKYGYPLFLDCDSWQEVLKHFDYLQCNSDEITLQFINKVRGKQYMVIPLTRNNSDRGIQLLKTVPCQFPSTFTVSLFWNHNSPKL